MRPIILSFLIFVVSSLVLFAQFKVGVALPDVITKFAPVALMMLIMLFQFDVLNQYKANLELKKLFHTREAELLKKIEALSSSEPSAPTLASAQANSSTEPNKSEALVLLSLLQERGRLIDFLMEDISSYSDQDIGAAARVVHQGGSKVLRDCFTVTPVAEQDEGSSISINEDQLSKFKLLGASAKEAPYIGKIIHRGWATQRIALPRPVNAESSANEHFIITPSEVEIS